MYRNEEAVGRAIQDSGLPRDAVFVTSKLAPKEQVRRLIEALHACIWTHDIDHGASPSYVSQGAGKAYAAMCDSVDALGLGYVDLYLIHWPGASGLKSEDPANARLRHESYRDLQQGLAEGNGV